MSERASSNFDVYDIQYDVKLAANIIRLRMASGKTQGELAALLKTSQPAIARAENGDNPPSHKMLKKIARALGARLIPADFVLVREEVNSTNFIHSDPWYHAVTSQTASYTLSRPFTTLSPAKDLFSQKYAPSLLDCTH